MKFILLLTCLFVTATCMADRIYVSTDGTEDATGQSWADAQDILTALSKAKAHDEIFVMEGNYTLNTDDRTASFLIPAGVKLYGGFDGTEADIDERDLESRSVFSGEMGLETTVADNAYTVVIMKSDSEEFTILDGFTITGGSGRNFREGLTEGSSGGGLFIMAGEELSDHMIVNCVFESNKAHNGGAVMVDSGRPSFIGCTFVSNKADFNGGAVYNNGMASEASPIFRACVFADNSSNSGAGMTNNGTNGASTPLLLNCEFINNTSLMNGAAIYNITNESGEAEPIIEGCDFVGNDSVLGDDVSDMVIAKPVTAAAKSTRGTSLSPVRR